MKKVETSQKRGNKSDEKKENQDKIFTRYDLNNLKNDKSKIISKIQYLRNQQNKCNNFFKAVLRINTVDNLTDQWEIVINNFLNELDHNFKLELDEINAKFINLINEIVLIRTDFIQSFLIFIKDKIKENDRSALEKEFENLKKTGDISRFFDNLTKFNDTNDYQLVIQPGLINHLNKLLEIENILV